MLTNVYSDPDLAMKSRIPILPVIGAGVSKAHANCGPDPACVLDIGKPVFLDSGSSAISLALKYTNIKPGDEVLVPAYHCPTMVEPVERLGAKVVYYRINRDTSIDTDSVQELVSPLTRAILVPHFFGIKQAMHEIRLLCDRLDLVLIEDCAHSLLGEIDGKPPGYFADFAVVSTRKFFPGADGGCLVSNSVDLDQGGYNPLSLVDEARLAFDVLEEASKYGRIRPWNLLVGLLVGAKSSVRAIAGLFRVPRAKEMTNVGRVDMQVPVDVKSMSRAAKYLLDRSDTAYVREARLKNFRYLADRLEGVPGLKGLIKNIPDGMVPYMFPLVAEDENIYQALRQRGWHVWRWDDSDQSCEVSSYYSRHLIQLPCHQSLRMPELCGLADAIIESNSRI